MNMYDKEKQKNGWLRKINDKFDSMNTRTKFLLVLVVTAMVLYARFRSGKL